MKANRHIFRPSVFTASFVFLLLFSGCVFPEGNAGNADVTFIKAVQGRNDCFDRQRAELVKTCIEWGFLEQITISRDLMRTYHLQKYCGEGYAQLLRSFVPVLRESGVTDTYIDTIIIENAKRILTPELIQK